MCLSDNFLLLKSLTWSEAMENANMAELDFSGIVTNLPAGKHIITVDARTDFSDSGNQRMECAFRTTFSY